METIKIKFNRPKLFIFGAITGGFALLGASMFNTGWEKAYSFGWFIMTISTLFFGAGTLVLFYRAFSPGVGLTINDEGIRDSSSLTSIGLVKWKDIKGFHSGSFMGSGWIMVYVRNPESYIKNIKSSVKRGAVKITLQFFGSPISIGVAQLAIDQEKLDRILARELKKRRKK